MLESKSRHTYMFAVRGDGERTLGCLWPAVVGAECRRRFGEKGCRHWYARDRLHRPRLEQSVNIRLRLAETIDPALAAHFDQTDHSPAHETTPTNDADEADVSGTWELPCELNRMVTPRLQRDEMQLLEELGSWIDTDECHGLFSVDRGQKITTHFDLRTKPDSAVHLREQWRDRDRLHRLVKTMGDNEMMVVVLGRGPYSEAYITKVSFWPPMYATAVLDHLRPPTPQTPSNTSTPPQECLGFQDCPGFRVCFSPRTDSSVGRRERLAGGVGRLRGVLEVALGEELLLLVGR